MTYCVSDAALGVVTLASDGEHRDVRYGLPEPCAALGATVDARKLALAIAYGGERVDQAVYDARGIAIERPHPLLKAPGARFVAAASVWDGRRFAVAGVDAENGVCSILAERGATATRVAGFAPAPFALAWRSDRWLGLQLERDGDRIGLRVCTHGADGVEREAGMRWFVPSGAEARSARRRASDLLRALGGELSRGGYRDPAAFSLDVPALRLRLGADLELSLASSPALWSGASASPHGDLGLTIAFAEPYRPPTSLTARLRAFAARRRERRRLEAWAREIAGGLLEFSLLGARVRGGGWTLWFSLLAQPTPQALAELLRRIRARAAQGPR